MSGPTSVTWFRFHRPGMDDDIVGVVQGCGGIISNSTEVAMNRMRKEQERAWAGRPLTVYEPSPGFIRVYIGYGADGNGELIDVAIGMFEISVVAQPGDPVPSPLPQPYPIATSSG